MSAPNEDVTLSIAQTVPCTEAEGPGRRFAIWFQGCPLRCRECCNPQMLSFEGGTSVLLQELLDDISASRDEHAIEGITLIGGEPLAHAASAAPLAQEVQRMELSVMVFSGYTREEIHRDASPDVLKLLQHTDILVDGPYKRELPDAQRRWVGSTNQQIHFLTDRYSAEDAYWQLPNTLEIRLAGGELQVNGFPSRSAVGVWKRPRSTAK